MEDTFRLELNIDVVSKHPHCFLCHYARERKGGVLYNDPLNCEDYKVTFLGK